MKLTITAIGIGLGSFLTINAVAAELPNWTLDLVCSQESHVQACKAQEDIAQRQVSGPWLTIPDEIHNICLKEALSVGQPSYRLLKACLKDELFKVHQSARKKRSAE